MIFATWPPLGKSARVVVAVEPERIESLAYGVVVAPRPTRSVVVERVTSPTLFVVHPPAAEMPLVFIVPQATSPEEFVWSACEPIHEETFTVRVEENFPEPVTSKVFVGLALPIPT